MRSEGVPDCQAAETHSLVDRRCGAWLPGKADGDCEAGMPHVPTIAMLRCAAEGYCSVFR